MRSHRHHDAMAVARLLQPFGQPPQRIVARVAAVPQNDVRGRIRQVPKEEVLQQFVRSERGVRAARLRFGLDEAEGAGGLQEMNRRIEELFAAQQSEYKQYLFARGESRQVVGRGAQRLFVVADVEDEGPAVALDRLKPPRNERLFDPLPHVGKSRNQNTTRSNSQKAIVGLMRTREWNADATVIRAGRPQVHLESAQRFTLDRGFTDVRKLPHRKPIPPPTLMNKTHELRFEFPNEQRNPRSRDPQLFAQDGFFGIPQDAPVVERDARNDAR